MQSPHRSLHNSLLYQWAWAPFSLVKYKDLLTIESGSYPSRSGHCCLAEEQKNTSLFLVIGFCGSFPLKRRDVRCKYSRSINRQKSRCLSYSRQGVYWRSEAAVRNFSSAQLCTHKLLSYFSPSVVGSVYYGTGCIPILDTSEFWVCFLVLLIQETSASLLQLFCWILSAKLNFIYTVLLSLILLKTYLIAREDQEHNVPTLYRFIATDGELWYTFCTGCILSIAVCQALLIFSTSHVSHSDKWASKIIIEQVVLIALDIVCAPVAILAARLSPVRSWSDSLLLILHAWFELCAQSQAPISRNIPNVSDRRPSRIHLQLILIIYWNLHRHLFQLCSRNA